MMLKTPAPFPFPGAEALLGDKRVRIIRIEDNDRRYVQGKGISATVPLTALSDASLPDDPIERWRAERLLSPAATPSDAFTPIEDLYRDFCAFARARGVPYHALPGRIVFARTVAGNDMVSIVRRVDTIARRCLPVELRQPEIAA